VAQQGVARARSLPETPTAKLAKFFANAAPLRVPIRLTRVVDQDVQLSEETIIEFGTPREALFASRLPLEFADHVRLQNSDGSLDVEACVVAVQYNAGKTAVAARFNHEVRNWIVKS
jgi:hypothetical protein